MRGTEKFLTTLTALSVLTLIFVSSSPAGPDFKTIDTARLHSLVMDNAYSLEAGRGTRHAIVDARTKENYNEAHIASTISIPEADFEKSSALLPNDKREPLVVYGDDATDESNGKWADKAAAAGYTNIVVYAEGFAAWEKNRMPAAPLR